MISIIVGFMCFAVGVASTFFYRRLALNVTRHFAATLEAQVAAMTIRCGELADELAQAQADAKKQRGLADLHISKNEAFEAQARKAWQVHAEYGLHAGNAQAWLLRELENAVRLINKLRSEKNQDPIEVNPKLVNFLSDIRREQENNVEMYAPK